MARKAANRESETIDRDGMKTKSRFWRKLALFFLAGALTAGCARGTRSEQFYALSPMAVPVGESHGAPAGPKITVGPVQLPEALRRPQIVTRIGANRLEVSEFHRWAGSLEGDVLRVVAENLGILLGTAQVARYPLVAGVEPDFRITLDIRQLDGRLGKSATLEAVWTVWLGAKGSEVAAGGKTVLSETVATDGYEALVAAYSRLLEALSREIAAAMPKR
jgi:uncharacterized lipoprotein YmbA